MRTFGLMILFAAIWLPLGAIGGFQLFKLVPAEPKTEAAAVIPILGGFAGAFVGFILGGVVGAKVAKRTPPPR